MGNLLGLLMTKTLPMHLVNLEMSNVLDNHERPSVVLAFGFVTMNDAEEGNRAIEAKNGKEMQGRPLKVNEACPKEDRPPQN